jgi:RNA polymerase sigma-70 factor (family 1)
LPNHSAYNENALLLRIAAGDEGAFSTIFKTYYNHLGEFIMRLTESESLTQEIVQDVFLKIWLNKSSLSSIECFKAYLLVVARNHALNCLKQIAREKNRQQEWVSTLSHQSAVTDSDEEIIDTGKLIDEAVDLLPPQQKKVYILSRRNGIRQHQIAKELNISHETVKKHMVLALRFLKNHLRTRITLLTIFIATLLDKL